MEGDALPRELMVLWPAGAAVGAAVTGAEVTPSGETGAGVAGVGAVTTRLTGPERTVYVPVSKLLTVTLGLRERVQRSGHLSEGEVAMQRFTVHSTYI